MSPFHPLRTLLLYQLPRLAKIARRRQSRSVAFLLLGILCFIALAAWRGVGWLGLPLSCVSRVLLLFASASDGTLVVLSSVLAAGAAMSLPRTDRMAAAGVGTLAAFTLLFVLPQGGADSPVNFFFAICSAAFSVGALLGTVRASMLRRSL